MKTHFKSTTIKEHFFHRYLVNAQPLDKAEKAFQDSSSFHKTLNLEGTSTSLHPCRLIQVGQEDISRWPMYLLKRVGYICEKTFKKGKYQIFDQSLKKVSQIRTEYLCYQIMSKSHRVVHMAEIINENSSKKEDNDFFYGFLGRRKEQGVKNACFVLEFCNGGNLEERILDFRKPLEERQMIMYGCQVLEGLVELKKKGILHRDLRPCNIFLHDEEIKFGDFDSAFIYKESDCASIKNGIDINTTPQEIVELVSLSDEELEVIGNLKLFDLQSKCDIYFFGMILFKMVFKRDYEKKYEGTDLDYLIREKVKEGFSCPQLLEVMCQCLFNNVEKRIDLAALYDQFKLIEKQYYFLNSNLQRTYLSQDPLNLFSYSSLEPRDPEIMTEIQNSINHTFTLSFASIQYDFEADFKKAALTRSTTHYEDEARRVLGKFQKTNNKENIWKVSAKEKKQAAKFLKLMEEFIIQTSKRAYYYDYLYRVILKIDSKAISRKEQKSIVSQNKQRMEKELILILMFLFEILGRTPFKIDRHYSDRNLPYEARQLFREKVKISHKFAFFQGRARTFDYQQSDTYRMIQNFFSIDYDEQDAENFQTIHQNLMYLLQYLDKKLKQMLRVSIVDLMRPYEYSKKKIPYLKELLFILITLERQDPATTLKSALVEVKELLEPLFSQQVELDQQQANLFFNSYKLIHYQEVEEARKKQNIQISFNLLSVSKKHLDCIAAFIKPPTQSGRNVCFQNSNYQLKESNDEAQKQEEEISEDNLGRISRRGMEQMSFNGVEKKRGKSQGFKGKHGSKIQSEKENLRESGQKESIKVRLVKVDKISDEFYAPQDQIQI